MDADGAGEGGEDVHLGGDGLRGGAAWNVAGPCDDRWDADTALEGVALGAAEWSVVCALGGRAAVVGDEEDDGGMVELEVAEGRADFTGAGIDFLDLVAELAVRRSAAEFFGGVAREMDGVEREVEEERAVAFLGVADECEELFGVAADEIELLFDAADDGVVFEKGELRPV